jgi:hypothetical protein
MCKIKFIAFCIGCLFSATLNAQVLSEELTALSIGTIGVPTVFQSNLWGENPDVGDVVRQINDAGMADLDQTEREILRQVLLTDVAGVPSLEKENQTYLIARLNAMLNQGFYEDVLVLLEKMPEVNLTSELKLFRLKTLFGLGRVDLVCEEGNLSLFGDQEAFIRVVCADALGTNSAAVMAYDVYRDSGLDDNLFLKAAGDKIYHHLDRMLPDGKPLLWELPIVVKAFGSEVLNRSLSRGDLVLLSNSASLSDEVRQSVENLLKKPEIKINPNGKILDDLMLMAKQRQALEHNLPSDMLQKIIGSVRGE